MPTSAHRRRFFPPLYFLVITLLYLMPLPLHWTTHIPGDSIRGDSIINAWPFWYYPFALTHGYENLLHPNLQFYPDGISLLLTTSNPVGSILMMPVTLLFGVCAAINTWIFLQLWTGGWLFYLFLRKLGAGNLPAYLGGTAYAFSPFVSTHLVEHYSLICIGFPAAILYLGLCLMDSEEGLKQHRILMIIALGILWADLVVTDFYLTLMTAFLFIGLLFHVGLTSRFKKILNWKLLISLGTAGLISVVCVAPVIKAVIQDRDGKDFRQIGRNYASEKVVSPVSLVVSPRHHWIQSFATNHTLSYDFSELEQENGYIGFSTVLIAFAGLIYGVRVGPVSIWLLCSIVFLGLAGGNRNSPNPVWEGTPLNIGAYWPSFFPFADFRVPSRWTFALHLSLTIIGSMGLSKLVKKFPSRKLAIILSAILIMAIDLFRPPILGKNAPLDSGIPSTIVVRGTVLDFPIHLKSGNGFNAGVIDQQTFLRQMTHERPILSVYTARVSREAFDARMADPEFKALIDLQGQNKSGVAPTIPNLDWTGFAKRYDITTIRIPTEFRYTEVFKDLGNRMLPGIEWQEYPGEIIGNAAPGSPDQ